MVCPPMRFHDNWRSELKSLGITSQIVTTEVFGEETNRGNLAVQILSSENGTFT